MGVPRSGTTAVAELLNAHPQVCLGIERFKRLLLTPELGPALFDRERFFDFRAGDTNLTPATGRNWAALYARLAAQFDQATLVGDKIPEAYRRLGPLRRRFAGVRLVYCLRQIEGVAASWAARAANPADVGWPRGHDRDKALATWSAANRIVLRDLRHAGQEPDLFVLPYEAFFGRRRRLLAALLAFLGLPPVAAVRAKYEALCDDYVELRSKRAASAPTGEPLAAADDLRVYRALVRHAGGRRPPGSASAP
jgi:hypothetical protein